MCSRRRSCLAGAGKGVGGGCYCKYKVLGTALGHVIDLMWPLRIQVY